VGGDVLVPHDLERHVPAAQFVVDSGPVGLGTSPLARTRPACPEQQPLQFVVADRRRDRPRCGFRSKSATCSGMKSAADSDLKSAVPI
jgi:hypothetical protein